MKDRPYLETFDGLEALEKLESLEIFLAPRLRDFTGRPAIANHVRIALFYPWFVS